MTTPSAEAPQALPTDPYQALRELVLARFQSPDARDYTVAPALGDSTDRETQARAVFLEGFTHAEDGTPRRSLLTLVASIGEVATLALTLHDRPPSKDTPTSQEIRVWRAASQGAIALLRDVDQLGNPRTITSADRLAAVAAAQRPWSSYGPIAPRLADFLTVLENGTPYMPQVEFVAVPGSTSRLETGITEVFHGEHTALDDFITSAVGNIRPFQPKTS